MTERKTWARRLAEDPATLLAFNAPPDQVAAGQPASKAPALETPPMDGLFVALDETDLPAVAQALQSGETRGLPAGLAEEVSAAHRLGLFRRVKVPGAGGAELDAGLWLHRDGRARPAIVMPSPWITAGWLVYTIQALRFANKGYHVLAYSARGFGDSGGEVEVAGKDDITDATMALNFLIAQTQIKPPKVGFLGDSYGSGISQIVAARDNRIDAVVAMSTWGDVGRAFFENNTRHLASIQALLGAAEQAHLSEETQRVFKQVLAGDNVEDILANWAPPRSPVTYVDALNARKVPIFFAHAWHETLFPTNQTLDLFNRLVGPKRLDLSIGDHSGPELSGMLGLPNRIWTDAHRWFDRFLRDDKNGIDTEGQVVSQVMWNPLAPPEIKPKWQDVTRTMQKLFLTAPATGSGDGALADAASTGWNLPFKTGVRTVAEVADQVVVSGIAEILGRPKRYQLGEVPRSHALVFSTQRLTAGLQLRGLPSLHVTFRSVRGCTFVAYLFDADADGNARIITHAPFTAAAGTAGKLVATEITLQATGYDLAAGRRLMLVIDGQDAFYSDANGIGIDPNTITISSSAGEPSYLELPIG